MDLDAFGTAHTGAATVTGARVTLVDRPLAHRAASRGGGVSGILRMLFPPPPKVTVEQARDLQRNGAVLPDVRQDAEWRAGHAPGAWHMPLEPPARRCHGRLPPRVTVVTICRPPGHRSALAAALLARESRKVASPAGGMRAWARAGLPVVASGGRPGWVL